MTEDREPDDGLLARLRTDLAGPRGYKRVDALLSMPDAEAAVAALSPPELHELVTQVGFQDTQDLIALATPEQIRGCLDLDGWDRDQPLIEPMRPWLAAVLEAGPEKFTEMWAGLDPEMRAIYLQRNAVIYDLTLGENVDDIDGDLLFTVDTFFCLQLTGNDDARRFIRMMIDALYQIDGDLARNTIMAARSEPSTELEEMAYRWRSGRLADLGYVDFYEALAMFQPLEPDQVQIGEGTEDRVIVDEQLPATIAEELVGRSFLTRALDRLGPEDADRMQGAILVLTNKVMAAARVRPGDLDALRRGAHYATATLSLGLEVVARGDLERAEAALRTISVTRLHRVGYTVPLKLARLARALAPRAATAGDPAGSILAAMVGLRPWMSNYPAPGVRPFESQADVRAVAELLARLALRIAIAEGLGVDLIAMAQTPEPRPALDDPARTAMVHAMLGAPPTATALTDDELARFRATCFAGATLDDDAAERAGTAITRRLDELQITAARDQLAALIVGWLADLERTFGSLASTAIDGRFLEGVITAGARS